ncbi:hypothetical protein TWF696_004311 [Orbilia brochopaga]|uniref:Uncharacterized protein n=1 Tax=Orbilia brochopaga TaxID=3140254 RepID=A0AAV9V8R2_9PEZI
MKFTLIAVFVASILGAQAAPNPIITPAPAVKREAECPPATVTETPICAAVLCPSPTTPLACPLIIRVTQIPCTCQHPTKTITFTPPCCTTECIIPTETTYTGCCGPY